MFEGRDVLEIGIKHIGEKYVLGTRADLHNKDFKGPWDCAEFTSWCVFQAYGIEFGMSRWDPRRPDPYSGAWYKDARDAGTLISVSDAARTPGAALLRLSTAKHSIGHVAFSQGNGTTLEARGKKYGVGSWDVYGSGRVWHHGALIPGILYEQAPEITPPPGAGPELLRMENPYMRGAKIEELQRALRRRSFHPGNIDGIFGPQTELAVINYQISKGLTPDGIVGPDTAREIGITL